MHRLLLSLTFTLCFYGQAPNYPIDRVAGIRPSPFQPVAARDALLSTPYAVAVDRAGDVYFQDRGNFVIRRLSTSGVLTVFAGNGLAGATGDGGPATSARISHSANSITFGPDGALNIADGASCTFRRVTTAGTMERVAGMTNQCGYSGDGGPALWARFNFLGTVSFDSAGSLYIGDPGNHRVRKVRTDGVGETIASTGVRGYSGDGGPANQACLDFPFAFADAAGNVLIMESWNFRIHRVNAQGVISTIAGTGTRGSTPDEGPALTSGIGWLTYRIVHPNGNLYFTDRATHKIYALTPGGMIRRVAGTGGLGFQAMEVHPKLPRSRVATILRLLRTDRLSSAIRLTT